jgi:PST family polysaccharide transporter
MNETPDARPWSTAPTDNATDAICTLSRLARHRAVGGAAVLDHFRTDHLLRNLGQRAVSGGCTVAASQAIKFFLNLASAMVLARLLAPAEFGLVAMVLAATALLELFKEAGLSTATVQRETISQQQVSNLFWINLGLSACMTVACMALSGPLAWFYQDSRLTGITTALSFTFVITGSTVQHRALLTRQMRFRALAAIEIVSTVTGAALACYMAWSALGYWSLVAMQLCTVLVSSVMTWRIARWTPSGPRCTAGLTSLLHFGAHLTAADLTARTARAFDAVLVGRLFGAEALGIYSRASILTRPLDQLMAPINAVVIPVLSRLQSDPERYRRTHLLACDLVALVTFPVMAEFLALSAPLVRVLLGDGWEDAIPLFAAFALAEMSQPLVHTASWLFVSQGRGADLFRTFVPLSVLTIASFLAGVPWGAQGVVLSFAIYAILIRLPILYYMAGLRGPVGMLDLWKSLIHHLPCWVAVYAGTASVRLLVSDHAPLVQLLLATPTGVLIAIAMILLLRRPRESAYYALHSLASRWQSRHHGKENVEH